MSRFYQMSDWEIIFNPKNDGYSMLSLIDKIKNRNNNIIILKDSNGVIFGGFNQ